MPYKWKYSDLTDIGQAICDVYEEMFGMYPDYAQVEEIESCSIQEIYDEYEEEGCEWSLGLRDAAIVVVGRQ